MILLDLCVSSLRRGHANLLCIVPSLVNGTPLRGPENFRIRFCYIKVLVGETDCGFEPGHPLELSLNNHVSRCMRMSSVIGSLGYV